MIEAKDIDRLVRELTACLQFRFPDVSVRIGKDIHYPGLNVVVTSSKFAGLLAEQRFHHVVRAIPKELYEKHFQRGVVWFELAPGETGKDLMRMPRSSDLSNVDESDIRRRLMEAGYFKKLGAYFDSAEDEEPSGVSFDTTRRILSKVGLDAALIEQCCLYLVRKGAYCDAHVVNDLIPALSAESAA